ncbi:TetR/AcrR family transcriptional regulator [Frankia sp. Cr2]|uniref:TetR/AcrR family transcriptional regulator n=1 Tax=Frankia sp. Cr2 TaxID=3073932 RepID=UPI002AD32495|nr:TetR family transcriptional regulator [Frankia sp. Cr2]
MTTAKQARAAQPLDTDLVVRAALDVTREFGIDAVSMRVVADRLGVTPMALYRWVDTKDLLIKLVADEVVGQVALPDPGRDPQRDWRAMIMEAMTDYRRVAARYPGVATLLLHGGFLPKARRLVAAQLDVLERAGLTPEQARRMYASYQLLTLGRLTVDEARRTRPARGPSHVRDPKIDAYLTELQHEDTFEDGSRLLLDDVQRAIEVNKAGSRRT